MAAAVIAFGAGAAVAGTLSDGIVIISEPTTLILFGAAVGARLLYAHLRERR
jgi:hypothetical protein